MSLIKCNECGKEISDQAKHCPNCGVPIPTLTPQSNQNVLNSAPVKQSGLGIAALVFSIVGCTFIVGIILAIIDLCKKDKTKKHSFSIASLVICGVWIVIGINFGNSNSETSSISEGVPVTEQMVTQNEEKSEIIQEETTVSISDESTQKYSVGDIWKNKNITVTYLECGEYTEFNQFNTPTEGNKVIYAKFEFENIGKSDQSVMYTDFHGYADGYEVNQSYAPEGTGLDFSVKLSSGRKGNGIIAFEVPESAQEIEMEFSPNMFKSEKVIFVYSE